MGSLIRSFALLVLVASCDGGEGEAGEYTCAEGQQISDGCASASGAICESATCVEGQWQCPEELFPTQGCRPAPEPGLCSDGQEITHACANAEGSICESSICVAGQWECPEGLFESAGCFVPPPNRDCSDLGGGQAILGERCLEGVVEYCIYSDTTQTATWSVIRTCTAPDSCQELNDEACCQSENGICLD
jgi:hypothetical protein